MGRYGQTTFDMYPASSLNVVTEKLTGKLEAFPNCEFLKIIRVKHMQSPMYRKNELSYYKLKGFYTNSVEEVNSHITEKIWERQKKPPSDGLLKMLTVKQKCVDFPKYGKIEFPIYGNSVEKNNILKLQVS